MKSRPTQISLEEIQSRLTPLFKDETLQLVLLFGSAAAGKLHSKSDIDLAFLSDGPVDILTITNQVIRFLHTDHIDIVDLRRANPLLKFSIMKNCKVIYEKKEGIFSNFYSLAFRIYIDSQKLRDIQAIAIKRFLKSKGL